MIRSLLPARSGSPEHRRKYEHRQQKKYPCNLKPNFAADTAKGLEEATKSPRNSTRGLSRNARLACNPSITGRACRSASLLRDAALHGLAHDGTAGDATGHPQSHAQHSPNGFRSHFVTRRVPG